MESICEAAAAAAEVAQVSADLLPFADASAALLFLFYFCFSEETSRGLMIQIGGKLK